MALKIYRAPDGGTWRYEEGEQPQGYVEEGRKARTSRPTKAELARELTNPELAEAVEAKRAREAQNKARSARNKKA